MASNHLCHFEFMVNDTSRSRDFYTKVFDWEFEKSPGPVDYTMIKTGKEPDGGMMKKPAEAPHPALSVYFFVDDVNATLEKVKAAGGSVIAPKTEITDLGWWAMFADPDGIVVGIYEAKK